MASALQGCGYHALVLWAATSFLPVHYFSVGGHKAAQGLAIFIVYGCNLVCAEVTILLYKWNVSVAIALLRSHRKFIKFIKWKVYKVLLYKP